MQSTVSQRRRDENTILDGETTDFKLFSQSKFFDLLERFNKLQQVHMGSKFISGLRV